MRDGLWNVNIHYDSRLDAQVPAGAQRVLEVGCGDGLLAARLARRVPQVVALDVDEPVLGRARARFPDVSVTWRHGDVLTADLEPASFDAVVSNATLHHLPDAVIALERLGSLVRPGGALAVVTFVRGEWREAAWVSASFVARGIAVRLRGNWMHTAPMMWPPADTLRQLRDDARRALPGSRVRRLLLGRVLIRWQAPG